jgi:hypothetical protein
VAFLASSASNDSTLALTSVAPRPATDAAGAVVLVLLLRLRFPSRLSCSILFALLNNLCASCTPGDFLSPTALLWAFDKSKSLVSKDSGVYVCSASVTNGRGDAMVLDVVSESGDSGDTESGRKGVVASAWKPSSACSVALYFNAMTAVWAACDAEMASSDFPTLTDRSPFYLPWLSRVPLP